MRLLRAPDVEKLRSHGDLKGLSKALRDKDPEIRRSAARALQPEADALDKFEEWLRRGDAIVAHAGPELLARVLDPGVVKPLLAALEDPDPDVRRESAIALGRRRDRKVLRLLLERAKTGPERQVIRALETLGYWDVGVLADSLADASLRKRLLKTLTTSGGSPLERIDQIISSSQLVSLLSKKPSRADLEHAGKSWLDLDALAGALAAFPTTAAAVERAADKANDAVVRALSDRMKDSSPEVREVARAALEQVGGADVTKPLRTKPKRQTQSKKRASPPKVKQASETQRALALLDDAYLVSQDDELESRVASALDGAANQGPEGVAALMVRLYRDMQLEGDALRVSFGGDEAWNEWLRKRAVVEAVGRARAESALPDLIPLLSAASSVTQFYEILQPAVARALGEIGDKRALEPLRAALRSPNTWQASVRAIGTALERLEGATPVDVQLIVAEADSLYQASGGGLPVIDSLERITDELFADLGQQDKYYVWYLRGESYKQLGDTSRAIDCYRSALTFFSDPNAMAYERLEDLGEPAGTP